MSRVAEVPTWELWGISKKKYRYHLQTTGKTKVLIDYYEGGIEMAIAANRDLIGTHQYKEIVGTHLEQEMKQRDSMIVFYRKRLAELKGK